MIAMSEGISARSYRPSAGRGGNQLGDPVGGVAVAVERRVLGRGRVSASAFATAAGSIATSRFQPSSIVSTHSLVSRSVRHGTDCR